MATPKMPMHETPQDAPPVVETLAPAPETAVAVAEPPAYTLDAAFSVLRKALAAVNQDDNMTAYLQAQESQLIYDNAGGNVQHPNCVTAWRLLIPLLEQAIGATVRIT